MGYRRLLLTWWRWSCVAAALCGGVAAAAEQSSPVAVSCSAPTRISACGRSTTLLPRWETTGGQPPPCAGLCAGRALLLWAPAQWTACAAESEETAGRQCAGEWGGTRVAVRCRGDAAEAVVACGTGTRRRRRGTDGEDDSEAPTAVTTAPAGGEAAEGGEAAVTEATAAPEAPPPEAPPPEAPPEPPATEAPATEAATEAAAPAAPEEGAATSETPATENPEVAAAAATSAASSGEDPTPAAGVNDPQQAASDWEHTLTVVLGALVAVLVVGVLIGGIVLWRWRRRSELLLSLEARGMGDGAEEKPLRKRVALSALEAYVENALREEDLRHQHAQLPRGCVRPALCGRRPDNKRRNRYNDLVAYDESRVILQPFPGEDPLPSDYINANYVNGYSREKEFIAAQAPMASTAADFWRMLWTERVRVLVTLCAVREGAVEKCFQYWPSAGAAAAHGSIAVTCAREECFPDLVVRELRAARGDETRQVVQLQFTAWPDHGVPRHPEAVTALLRRVARARAQAKAQALAEGAGADEGPLLVHCSAGVGRTGTVLLALLALEQAPAEGAVDMLALLQALRRQRPNLVDSPEQYEAAHRILVQALLGAPLVLVADASLGARVREAAAAGELRAQWHRLQPASSTLTLEANSAQAAASALLELDGYRARGRFVAAPALPSDASWRQVAARGLRVAVLLQDAPEGEGPWPKDNATSSSDVGVRVVDADTRVSVFGPPSSTAASEVQEQRLELRAAGVEGRSLRLLRSRARWPADADVPEGGARPLLRLWRAATAAANAAATSAAAAAAGAGTTASPPAPDPVLLLCGDGRRGCGLFAALSVLLEQIQAEGECCVAEAVQAVRRAHNRLLCSEEQFLFLYEAAVTFVEDSLVPGTPR